MEIIIKAILVILAIYLIIKIFSAPIKLLFRLLLDMSVILILIFILNLIRGYYA